MIKFISYTGEYPTLCFGALTVEIDGKTYIFGSGSDVYDFSKNAYKENCYEAFWVSGGGIRKDADWYMWAEQDDWLINSCWNKANSTHPQWIIDLLPELIKIFNENVPQGCCGGCI